MWNKVRYILLTAQRDSLFFSLAAAIVFSTYVAFFLGSTAVVEEGATSLVYSAGMARMVLVLGLIVFVCFHIRRSFENREIDLMLVHPISRTKFILSFLLGYSMIALFFVVFTAGILYLFAEAIPYLNYLITQDQTEMVFIDPNGFAIWVSSIFLEAIIISSLAMTASLILRSTVLAVLLSLGFYALARMVGFILMVATKPGNHGVSYDSFKGISAFIPRLDFFGKTEWLLYGFKSYDEIYYFLIQAAIFITLLMALSVYDFKKKEF